MTNTGHIAIDRALLEILFRHAASAALLVGCLDEPIVGGPLAEHVDTLVHELSELLGDPHALVAPRTTASAGDGGSTLTSCAGGTP